MTSKSDKITPAVDKAKVKAFEELALKLWQKGSTDLERRAFLLCLRLIQTPQNDLCQLWISQYLTVQKSPLPAAQKTALTESLFAFLRLWVREYYFTTPSQRQQIKSFLQKQREEKVSLPPEIINSFKLLVLRSETQKKNPSKLVGNPGGSPASLLPVAQSSPNLAPKAAVEAEQEIQDFMAIPSPVLVRELTLYDFELFQGVKLGDWFLGRERNSSHQTQERTSQVKVLCKFLRLASGCLDLRNFNSLMAIFAGLGHHSVRRLKIVWDMLPARYMQAWQELEELMSPIENFKNYREVLRASPLPVMPYIGVFSRDLTLIHEGNKCYLDNGAINMELLELVHERLKSIFRYQNNPMIAEETSPAVAHYVRNLDPIWDEEELHRLSLKSQPSLWKSRDRSESDFSTDSESQISSDRSSGSVSETERELSRVARGERRRTMDDDSTSGSELTEEDEKEGKWDEDEKKTAEEMRKQKRKKRTKGRKVRTTGPQQSQKGVRDEGEEEPPARTVRVSSDLMSIFTRAEDDVARLFASLAPSPKWGEITLFGDDRYLMLRASSLSAELVPYFRENLGWLLFGVAERPDFVSNLLYDMGCFMGLSDCESFRKKMGYRLKQDNSAVAAGAISCAYSGWFASDLTSGLPMDLTQSPDAFQMEQKCLNSFEADSWLAKKDAPRPNRGVCVLSCGYLAGWLRKCLRMEICVVETSCRAKGDAECRFTIAHKSRIDSLLETRHTATPRYLSSLSHVTGRDCIVDHTKSGGKKRPPLPAKEVSVGVYSIQAARAKQFESLFEAKHHFNPSEGVVRIGNERYLLVRAHSLTVDLFTYLKGMFPVEQDAIADARAAHIIHGVGKAMGRADFTNYATALEFEKAPAAQLIIGLGAVLANQGWGRMEMDMAHACFEYEGKNKNAFYLKFTLRNSVEAALWSSKIEQNKVVQAFRAKKGKLPTKHKPGEPVPITSLSSPACVMCSGYTTGYIRQCLAGEHKAKVGVVEVSCKALGHKMCEFIAAPVSCIHTVVGDYLREAGREEDLPNMRLFLTYDREDHHKPFWK
ncbi:hypothetical protein QOT17_007398 [Balamuthia mandrillaris]